MLDAGDAPISFTADVGGSRTGVFSSCNYTQVVEANQQIARSSVNGVLELALVAPYVDPDPLWTPVPSLYLDNLVITGYDVSQANMVSRFANTPEPSSVALIAIAGVAFAITRCKQ